MSLSVGTIGFPTCSWIGFAWRSRSTITGTVSPHAGNADLYLVSVQPWTSAPLSSFLRGAFHDGFSSKDATVCSAVVIPHSFRDKKDVAVPTITSRSVSVLLRSGFHS